MFKKLKSFISKNTWLVIFVLILGFIFLLIYLFSRFQNQPEPLKVVSHQPENLELASPLTEVLLEFNRPLISLSEVKISLSPQFNYHVNFSKDKKTIVLDPVGPFNTNQTVEVVVFEAIKDQKIAEFKFKTKNLQTNPRLIWERDQVVESNFPLIDFLPYQGEGFTVYGNNQTNSLDILVRKLEDLNQIKTKVDSWIRSKGVDPRSQVLNWYSESLSPIP